MLAIALALLQSRAPTLVDAHLVRVPSLGTLTARRLAGGDLQVLGGQADGALDAELLGLGTVDELLADLLEGLDVARGEGDADLVDLGTCVVCQCMLLLQTYRCLYPRQSPSRACCKTCCRIGRVL